MFFSCKDQICHDFKPCNDSGDCVLNGIVYTYINKKRLFSNVVKQTIGGLDLRRTQVIYNSI